MSQSQKSLRRTRRTTQQSLSQPQPSTSRAAMLDNSDEHMPLSQISPNKTLTTQEHEHHVANVVKYILSANHTNIPIVKSTISKATNCQGKNFRAVMISVEKALLDVFGYQIVDVDNGKFIIYNTVKSNFRHLKFDEDTGNRYSILMLALSHIYMCNGSCSEVSLRHFYINLGILNENDPTTGEFGDVMRLITTDFVKEKYIEQKDEDVLWGKRAWTEVSPRSIMEFVSKVYGRDMKTWPQQYEMMRKQEQQLNGQMPNGVENNVPEAANRSRRS